MSLNETVSGRPHFIETIERILPGRCDRGFRPLEYCQQVNGRSLLPPTDDLFWSWRVSLFEDSRFVYRDTFFVYFQEAARPTAAMVKSVVVALGDKYEIENLKECDGKFESITVHSPQDYSAMDITHVSGEEVLEQIKDLMNEFKLMTLTGDDRKKIAVFERCNARLDVFHFEQLQEGQDEDEILDPGGLLLVLEGLATICKGVSLDPQSQTLL